MDDSKECPNSGGAKESPNFASSIISLHSTPPTAFLFHLCPLLTAYDLLMLREVSKRIHDLLHKEDGALHC